MRSEGNRIIFDRKVGGDSLSATAAIYNIIHKLGYKDIILGFQHTESLWPEYMIPLITTCRFHRYNGVDFDIILPKHPGAALHFSNTNWAFLIDPEKFDEKLSKSVTHMSAQQYFTAEDHHRIVDDILGVIIQSVSGIDRTRLKALEWSLSEVMDNVLNHAQSPVGGIVQAITDQKNKRVDFIVCDAGITIPTSLMKGRPDLRDDTSALRAAIEEGVTSNKATNQGNGLFGTFKCCEVSEGQFSIISGNVFLHHRPGQLHVGKSAIRFGGTYVRASIGYETDRLLERALVFGGRAHDPPHDFIERKYEGSGDDIVFVMSSEVNAFGSREAGRLARTKIDNLMSGSNSKFVFDFSGVRLISSSFADEVFGKLFLDLGPINFTRYCDFRNTDPTVRILIDRAISQRMRAY